jgi:hypothetical protein
MNGTQNLKMTEIKSLFHTYIKPTPEMKKMDDYLHSAACKA